MSERIKLSLFETLALTLRWTKFILRRHWGLALALLFVNVVLSFSGMISTFDMLTEGGDANFQYNLFSIGGFIFFIISFSIFSIVVHREILVGPAGLNQVTLGHFGNVIFGYFIDIIVIILSVAITMIIVFGVLFSVLTIGSSIWIQKNPFISFMIIPALFSILILVVLLFARLTLRLPSRGIGQSMPWRSVLRIGKSNSWRLFLGLFLIAFLPGMMIFIFEFYFGVWPSQLLLPSNAEVEYLENIMRNTILGKIIYLKNVAHITPQDLTILAIFALFSISIYTVQVVMIPTFLSLAYAQLYDNLTYDPKREVKEDPDRPPWEYDDDYR